MGAHSYIYWNFCAWYFWSKKSRHRISVAYGENETVCFSAISLYVLVVLDKCAHTFKYVHACANTHACTHSTHNAHSIASIDHNCHEGYHKYKMQPECEGVFCAFSWRKIVFSNFLNEVTFIIFPAPFSFCSWYTTVIFPVDANELDFFLSQTPN